MSGTWKLGFLLFEDLQAFEGHHDEDLRRPAQPVLPRRRCAAGACTRDAAQRLEISGTPGLIIGTQVIPGAISLEQMRETVAAERAKRS